MGFQPLRIGKARVHRTTAGVSLSKADFKALGLSVGEHVEACHDRWEALTDELQSAGAVSPAALEAVDITAGWPPVAPFTTQRSD